MYEVYIIHTLATRSNREHGYSMERENFLRWRQSELADERTRGDKVPELHIIISECLIARAENRGSGDPTNRVRFPFTPTAVTSGTVGRTVGGRSVRAVLRGSINHRRDPGRSVGGKTFRLSTLPENEIVFEVLITCVECRPCYLRSRPF